MNVTVQVHRTNAEWPKYAQVKNHVEMFGVNILDYTNVPARFNGIPSVFQLIQSPKNKPISLSPEVQRWMFGIFRECAPSYFTDVEIKKCWRNAFMGAKAFTNKTGWDNGYQDVILDENMGAENFKLQPTICHGATVKVMREPFMKGGVLVSEIEILDVLDPATLTRTYANSRHLIFPAINWYRFPEPFGKADYFPLFDEHDVPIPLLGYGTNRGYIETQWLRFITNDEYPANPYWPR